MGYSCDLEKATECVFRMYRKRKEIERRSEDDSTDKKILAGCSAIHVVELAQLFPNVKEEPKEFAHNCNNVGESAMESNAGRNQRIIR